MASFYRTTAGAEIDLVLELPGRKGPWAIEIKRSLAAKIEKGFHVACEDLQPARRILIYPGTQNYPIGQGIEAISLDSFVTELASL